MASRSLGQLTLDLVARLGGFQTGMDQAARVAEDRSRRIERSVRNAGRALTGLFAAVGGAALFRKVIQETISQERALKQLEARILSTGGAAGKTSGELSAFAGQLQKLTTYSDDAILAAQGLLLSFTNIRGDVFDRVTEAALDLATATGQDLPSAFRLLGIAVNDPLKGMTRLTRAGIQLDEGQKKLIKRLVETGQTAKAQGVILDKVFESFGGSARANADTLGGSLTQLKNSFDELFEAPGGVGGATAAVKEFTALLQDPQTIAAAGQLTTALIVSFGAAFKVISETAGAVKFLGESLAAAVGGPALDDLVRLEDELALLERIRRAPFAGRLTLFGPNGKFDFWDDAELDAEIQRLRDAVAAAGGTRSGGVSVSGVINRTLSDVTPPPPIPLAVQPQLDLAGADTSLQDWLDRLAAGQLTMPVLVSPKIELEELPTELERDMSALTADVQKWIKENTMELTLRPEIELLDVETELAGLDTSFQQLSESIGRGLHDTLVDAFLGVETSFSDLLRRMAAEFLTSSLLKSFGAAFAGGTGTWSKLAAGIFGGPRAQGGPVAAGTSYLVGEHGRELFTPNVNGMVTAGVGGVTINQSYKIDARGADSSLTRQLPSILEQQRRRGLADARDEMRRGRLR